MKKISILFALVLVGKLTAQDNDRVITTAVPFLTIAAHARAAGMGDMGVATSTDAFLSNGTLPNLHLQTEKWE